MKYIVTVEFGSQDGGVIPVPVEAYEELRNWYTEITSLDLIHGIGCLLKLAGSSSVTYTLSTEDTKDTKDTKFSMEMYVVRDPMADDDNYDPVLLADPDNEGLYPFVFNGNEYTVFGTLFEIRDYSKTIKRYKNTLP